MRLRPWTIGLFLALGFGFFTAILFLIGNRHKVFERHVELYSEMSDIGGLANGAKIRVSGLDAGEVKAIAIPKSPSGKYRLKLQLEEKVHALVRKDSVVSVATEGVVGDKFVAIKKGSERMPEANAGDTLPSKEPFDIADLMDKGTGLLTDVRGTVNDLHGKMNVALDSVSRTVNHGDELIVELRPDIRRIARDGTEITGQIDLLMTDLNGGKGPAGLLLKDADTRKQLQATLANVQQASNNLRDASAGAQQTISDFQSRQLPASAQVTLDHVQAVSARLDATLSEALAEDNLGQKGSENLRQTLANLNRSTANLADDTEALKHNFFFRGFFKKRGFYNVDELSPSEYEEACARQKGTQTRRWLPAAGLFGPTADGKEQLLASGRSEIDAQVAPDLNALRTSIVVVEGYANDGSPDEQYVASRNRADLVRHYLQMHYHLNHSNVGIVAMQDKPPQDAAAGSANGVAIALVGVRK